MGKYQVKQFDNLLSYDIKQLEKESKDEGFRFVERLVNEYKCGSNTFSNTGEGLFGVFTEEGTLVAIGGLNKDPFSNEAYIGRVTRFYVKNDHRRKGLGSLLVNRIIDEAKKYYHVLVLHTDTEQADQFYISLGFLKGDMYPKSSHYLELKNK